jgi:hypothetical protein
MSKRTDLNDLIAAYLDDMLTAEEAALLVERLATDRKSVEEFTRLAQADALLRNVLDAKRQESNAKRLRDRMGAHCDDALRQHLEPGLAGPAAPPPRGGLRNRSMRVFLGLAASLLLVSFSLWVYSNRHPVAPFPDPRSIAKVEDGVPVATLVRSKRLKWGKHEAIPDGSRLRIGDSLRFDRGLVEIAYDTGTVAVLKGPADATLRPDRLMEVRRGTVTANVAQGDVGFRVDTPAATVVDLSTAFGVSISDVKETNVVVFDGGIDLHLDVDRDTGERRNRVSGLSATPRHMTAGEGVLIDPDGRISRLVAFNSASFPTSRTFDSAPAPRQGQLITAVRDSFSAGETTKCYQIVSSGLVDDAPAYVDRVYQWNGITEAGIPEFLLHADYVMTFNDDKYVNRLEMEVTLAAPAMLYVFLDDRVPQPEWLTADFVDTGENIGLDEVHYPRRGKETPPLGAGRSIDSTFSIWKREIPQAMTVRLGSLEIRQAFDAADTAMYGVAAVPLDSNKDSIKP